MDILIGFTGFVGSNLQSQHKFERVYNSSNIKDAFGTNPDLCVYSGIRAEKFAADKFPENDLQHIEDAISNIKQIKPKNLVLISTIDVIPAVQSGEVYEDTPYETKTLTPYGQNRLHLENEIRLQYPDTLIVRLPALFGEGIKKNFVFDLINFIPAMLKKEKFTELNAQDDSLRRYYTEDDSNFFRLNGDITFNERLKLKDIFQRLGFSALNFTDSRSCFPFYNLKNLWSHILDLQSNNVKLAHMAVEPVSASEIYQAVYETGFTNEIVSHPFDYEFFKTRHTDILNGCNGYIFNKNDVLLEIVDFVKSHTLEGYGNA